MDQTGITTIAEGPNRTIIAAGGPKFDTARYFDIGPGVAVNVINNTAKEDGPTPVSFIVSRGDALPFDTRVYFNISGSATAPTLIAIKKHPADYTLSGMTFPSFFILGQPNLPFVDIPAGQTLTIVTLTPISDSMTEGTETAKFSIASNPLYDIAFPASGTVNILDHNSASSQTFNPTADAYVKDGADAGNNFGTASQLLVKKSSTVGDNRLAYLKFDLSSVSSVNSVKLQLFGALNNTDSPSLSTSLFSVADTSWSETGLTSTIGPRRDRAYRQSRHDPRQ